MWQNLSMRERAEAAIMLRRVQKQWVADQMGIHHTAISRVLRWMEIPESSLMLRTVRLFCRVLNLRLEWLVEGIGEMDAEPGLAIPQTQKTGEAVVASPPSLPRSPVSDAAIADGVAALQRTAPVRKRRA